MAQLPPTPRLAAAPLPAFGQKFPGQGSTIKFTHQVSIHRLRVLPSGEGEDICLSAPGLQGQRLLSVRPMVVVW
ncbi:unnamed protein product [Cuscuta campestris]|uniref:Uncharacterized protein n=2 Tax=Cuscuta sect. Cleistogrammica TaxID=1824901 RepID=A0A484NBY2_9ASTE|nr:hypothetical protein DM860_016732 [Cuscuta australis]VFQ98580.1 unnamed protein product [Cuscuta campestris]